MSEKSLLIIWVCAAALFVGKFFKLKTTLAAPHTCRVLLSMLKAALQLTSAVVFYLLPIYKYTNYHR